VHGQGPRDVTAVRTAPTFSLRSRSLGMGSRGGGLEDRHSPLRCRLAGQPPGAPWTGSSRTSPKSQTGRSIVAAPSPPCRHRSCGIALAAHDPCP
jgi:hypothetical protein